MIPNNFKEAFTYYKDSDERKIIELFNKLEKLRKYEGLINLNEKNVKESINNIVNSDTFILIDGPSCSGKSTLGKILHEKYGIEVIDIDQLAIEFFKQYELKHPLMTKKEKIESFDSITDKYISESLETIIKDNRKKDKQVVLVGCYINLVARAVVTAYLSRYYKNAISIFCFEDNEEKYRQEAMKRDKDFFINDLGEYEQAKIIISQYLDFMVCGFNSQIFFNFNLIKTLESK